MYSFLLAARQLYGDFLIELVAHLLYGPAEADGGATEKGLGGGGSRPSLSFPTGPTIETLGLVASLLATLLGMALWWFLLALGLLLLLLALLHRPLPAGIADRKKIALFEFLMRISNEYLGSLVEFCAGPAVRNKLTRGISYLSFPVLPRWFFQWFYGSHWCTVRMERIAGVRCRVYLPKGEARRSGAAIVYIHGGGWCIGRPRFYDGSMLYLARKLGLSVFSIDYSLSPEAKFPTALFECERVLEELHRERLAAYGCDPGRVALMGDSAGANLCAVLCQRALKAGRMNMIKCQLLVYPVIHMLNFRSPSYQHYYRNYPGTALLNPQLLIRWYLMYLGVEPTAANIRAMAQNRHLSKQIRENRELMELVESAKLPEGLPGQGEGKGTEKGAESEGEKKKNGMNCCWRGSNKVEDEQGQQADRELSERLAPFLVNPDICPLAGKNLEGLAPALILTAGVDILRDEGIQYAQKLNQFGVSVEWKHYEAAYHGILNMCQSAQRRRILADISDYLQRHLLLAPAVPAPS